jgi:hypothetical protein
MAALLAAAPEFLLTVWDNFGFDLAIREDAQF